MYLRQRKEVVELVAFGVANSFIYIIFAINTNDSNTLNTNNSKATNTNMASLEKASVEENIEPFVRFICH